MASSLEWETETHKGMACRRLGELQACAAWEEAGAMEHGAA
ncbi:hypothetical protein [Komagataeibacter sp. FXV3]|nr:hypothetical protein [Komagataeibacter sp. FXV3]